MGLSFRLSTKGRNTLPNTMVYEVLARWHNGSIDQYAKTGVFVPSRYYDKNGNLKVTWQDGAIILPKIQYASEEQRLIRDTLVEAKARLRGIEDNVQRAADELAMLKELPHKGWLQAVIDGKTKNEITDTSLIKVFTQYIDNPLNRVGKESKKHLHTMLNALTRYEAQNHITLEFDTLSPGTLEDIRNFIKAEKRRSDNYLITLFKRFRTFIRWANGLGKDWRIEPLTHNNPFDRFSIGAETYGTPFYLTIDERNKLLAYEFGERMARQRDIFVFQCLIGCRVSDLWAMTKDNIIDGAVEYIPRKTKEGRPITVRVPLNKQARAILDRYKDMQSNRLFPFVNQKQYNEDIKSMLKDAGITRMVTILNPKTKQEEKRPIYEVASSHMARRTFVGNLYKQVKDPALVGKLSGHTEGSRAFARYRDIDEEMMQELVGMLE